MRRLATACLIALFMAATAAASLQAQETTEREYAGVTTDLADFKLVVDGGITSLEIGVPTASVSQPCFESGTITLTERAEILKDVIVGTIADRTITDTATGEPRVLRLSGQVFGPARREYGLAIGELSISAVGPDADGLRCNPRSFGWVAATRLSEDVPVAGGVYRGTVLSGQGMGGLAEGGSASLAVTTDAASLTEVSLTTAQECSPISVGDFTAPLENGVASFDEEGRVSTAIPIVSKLRITVAGDRAFGVFYIDRSIPGCRPVGGYFLASVTGPATATPTAPARSSTPVPTPIASPSGGSITSGAIPLTGGIGLIVWGGGSGDQLVTASKCSRTSAAFWAANAGGGFDTYVPGAAIEAVNATWNARFPGTIPAGTPLLGRCI